MASLAARLWFLAPLLLSLVLPIVGPGPARGDVIAQYAFNPKQDNFDRTGPGYEATAFDALVLPTDVSLSDSVPDSDEAYIQFTIPPYDTRVLRLQPGAGSTDPDQAVANNRYFEFTVFAAPDFVLNLESLTFDCARGGPATPRGWVLRSSVDNFKSNIDTQLVETERPNLTPFAVDLSGAQFQGLSEVTFRIYTFVPGGGQSLEYDNLTVNGTVDPESR